MLAPVNSWTPLELLVNAILQKYFSTSYCLTIVSDTPLNIKCANQLYSIAPKEDLVSQILDASECGCSDYVINMRHPSRFMEAFDKVTHQGAVRRGDKKLLFMPFEAVNNSKDDLLFILSMKETSFVRNLLLILPTPLNEVHEAYDLVTHVYEGNNDRIQDAVIIDQWSHSQQKFIKNSNLFPHDMSNLQGRTIKVAGFTYAPYVLLDVDVSLSPNGKDGTEIRIMEEFCRWINCTMELISDDDEWGEFYENLTGIGIFGNLVEDKAEIGISALYSWYEEYEVLDFSTAIFKSAVTCLVPAPRILLSWDTPFLPFSVNMWIAIVLTFILSSIALTVAQGFSTRNVFLATFGMMATQSQSDSGGNWRIRSVTGWLLITGLVIDNAYGGGLASVFTLPRYEPSIDTIRDLVDRKLEWGATHDVWVFSLTLSQDELIKELVSQFRTYSPTELERKSFTRTMAFSIEKLPAGHFAIGEYITEEALKDMTLMIEEFYYGFTVVMLRKSSAFTEKFNVLIGRLHQCGLLLAWERQVALKYLNYKIQLQVKLSRSKQNVENVEPLKISQFTGVFLFYAAGVVTGAIAFVIEYFYGRKNIPTGV